MQILYSQNCHSDYKNMWSYILKPNLSPFVSYLGKQVGRDTRFY